MSNGEVDPSQLGKKKDINVERDTVLEQVLAPVECSGMWRWENGNRNSVIMGGSLR